MFYCETIKSRKVRRHKIMASITWVSFDRKNVLRLWNRGKGDWYYHGILCGILREGMVPRSQACMHLGTEQCLSHDLNKPLRSIYLPCGSLSRRKLSIGTLQLKTESRTELAIAVRYSKYWRRTQSDAVSYKYCVACFVASRHRKSMCGCTRIHYSAVICLKTYTVVNPVYNF